MHLSLYRNGRTKGKNFLGDKTCSLICTMMAEPRTRVLEEEEEESSLVWTTMAKPRAKGNHESHLLTSCKQDACLLFFFLRSNILYVCDFSSGKNRLEGPILEQSDRLVFIGLGAPTHVPSHLVIVWSCEIVHGVGLLLFFICLIANQPARSYQPLWA